MSSLRFVATVLSILLLVPHPNYSQKITPTECIETQEKYFLQNTASPVSSEADDEAQSPSKEQVYEALDAFNYYDYMPDALSSEPYISPPSVGKQRAYAAISSLGTEAIPYILQYIIDSQDIYDALANSLNFDYQEEYLDRCFFLSAVYEMLGVSGHYSIHWISPNGAVSSKDSFVTLAQYLLDFIQVRGLHPLYPFCSPEEANIAQDRIYKQLDAVNFAWQIYKDLPDYQETVALVIIFGEYAVPHILSYIMEHEGQELTADEEMNLGVLLHCAYRMLGVESTADWHMPAEPVSSTTDPFPYTRELIAHLGDYGLTMPDSSTP